MSTAHPALAAALDYATRGFPVFPCKPRSKEPATEHGFKDATTDGGILQRRLIAAGLDCNLAVATGGWGFVLEEDGPGARDWLRAMEQTHGPLPNTWAVSTSPGRGHRYFRSSVAIPCVPKDKLAADVEIKGEGGYVVCPPSIHPDGHAYKFLIGPEQLDRPAEAPAWLIGLIHAHQSAKSNGQASAATVGAVIARGQRNQTLTSLAGTMRRRGMSEPSIIAALLEENAARCSPPLDDDEVRTIAHSVMRYPPQADGEIRRGGQTAADLTALGVMASSLVMRRINWLWPRWLPRGMISLLDGDPELGKSQLVACFAAFVTTGTSWPDGSPCSRGNVIIVAGEDSLEGVWAPRLTAAGADLSRVRLLNKNPATGDLLSIPEDVGLLEKVIRLDGALLLVLDPIMPYLSEHVNANADKEVRRALTPLAEMLDRTACSGLMLRHLNKNDRVSNALYRGGGSIAFSAVARANLIVSRVKDEEDGFVLAASKETLSRKPKARRYTIREVDLGAQIITSRIVFGGESDHLADDLITAYGRQEKKHDTGEALLRQLLADGPMDSKVIFAAFEDAGMSTKTAYRLKDELGIKPQKMGWKDGWTWVLPKMDKVAREEGPDEDGQGFGAGVNSEYKTTEGAHTLISPSSIESPPLKMANGGLQALGHLREPNRKRCPDGHTCRQLPNGSPQCCGHPVEVDA